MTKHLPLHDQLNANTSWAVKFLPNEGRILPATYHKHTADGKQRRSSHRVVMADIHRVPQAEDGVSHSFQVRFAIAEVSGRLLQPFTEPFGAHCGLAVSVRGHEEYADQFTGAL